MYKNRITKWGFEKNYKTHEIEVIVRKLGQRLALGKLSILTLRGRLVYLDDVERRLRGRPITRHTGVETLRCFTPEIADELKQDPADLAQPMQARELPSQGVAESGTEHGSGTPIPGPDRVVALSLP
jgi:hypothetical protein